MKKAKILSVLGLVALLTACGPTVNEPTNSTADPTNDPTTSVVDPSTSSDPTSNPSVSEDPTTSPSVSEDPTTNPSVSEDPTTNPSVSEDPTTAPSTPEANVTTVSQSEFTVIEGYVGGDKNVSYSAEQGGGTSTPIVNNGVIRLYQSAAGNDSGSFITISVKNGLTIHSVKIGTAMATKADASIDGVSIGNKTLGENDIYTVDSVNDDNITFTCLGASKTERFYVNYIEVSYSGDAVDGPGSDVDTPEGWSESEVALMESKLYGYSLPFYDFGSAHYLYWDDEYQCISVEVTPSSSDVIHSYASSLEQEGFTASDSYDNLGYYDYIGYVSDYEYIEVQVYEDGNKLYIDAYPLQLLTQWPEEYVQEFIDSFSFPLTVPAYDGADAYDVYDAYFDYGIYVVFCYTSDTSSDVAYKEALEACGYTVTWDDEYGVYYTASDDGYYEIDFYYDVEYGALSVYLYVFSE